MKITGVESFRVKLADPAIGSQWGERWATVGITRVHTDAGITGYGFRHIEQHLLERVQKRLVGSSPLDIVNYLAEGVLDQCQPVEYALWDIAGKAAGLPVRSLLGSATDRIPYYLTCVWPGNPDQSDFPIEEKADQIARYHAMGHNRFKIRGWARDPLDDVRVLEAVRKKCGGRDRIELMIDRTADSAGWVWSYDQALEVARELERLDATWLEEPFDRKDLESHRRLCEEVDIPVTGGEYTFKLSEIRDYLTSSALDIVQPDTANIGGIWATRKAAALAEAFDKPCILHGTNGPDLAASLQVAATIPSCRMMEIALIFPPMTPEEMWEPANRILKSPGLFHLKDGYVELSKSPGLGIEIDEQALNALL